MNKSTCLLTKNLKISANMEISGVYIWLKFYHNPNNIKRNIIFQVISIIIIYFTVTIYTYENVWKLWYVLINPLSKYIKYQKYQNHIHYHSVTLCHNSVTTPSHCRHAAVTLPSRCRHTPVITLWPLCQCIQVKYCLKMYFSYSFFDEIKRIIVTDWI